jgi:subtilisin family serine protease
LALLSVVASALVTPGQVIFKTSAPLNIRDGKTGLTAFDAFLSSKGLKSITPIKGMPGQTYYLANISSLPDANTLASLKFPGIQYVQPNFLRQLHVNPNDPLYNQQLHYVSDVQDAWNYSTGSPLIKVGIVDSGVLIHHPDLQQNIWVNPNEIPDNGIDDDNNGYVDDWCGWDFADAPEMADIALGDYTGQDNDVNDENFHGTHVAGIVGACGNNGIGIAGVCWNVAMVPLRAGFRTLQNQGYLQDDDAAAAIIYATDIGCNVINMSWGDPSYSPIISDACEYAYARGVTLVASAGNDPGAEISYPAKLSCVISVGSVNQAKQVSGFSSYGVDLDLVAPGERILSTYKLDGPEQYFLQDGTSMSAPYVTGSIALLLSLQPGLSPQEVRSRLLNSTDDLAPVGIDDKTGHGLLNTKKLLDNLEPPFVDITSPPDQIGISGPFPIIGSVYGDDFARYTLCFKNLSDETMTGWRDIYTHNSYPEYHTVEVYNDTLGVFTIPTNFPDGKYLIRLQYEKTHNNILKYNYFRTIIIDRTAPALKPGSLYGFKRYDKQNLRYYISAIFDEMVFSELHITGSAGYNYNVYTSVMDTLQVWPLPINLPEGPIQISVTARNTANLTFNSSVYNNFLNISYEIVPGYGYEKEIIGAPRRPVTRMYDFNGNGSLEYIAMDMPNSGYGTVKAYEPQPGGHVTTHSFDDAFWPLDFGNTNASGQELLLLKGDTAYLWETGTNNVYPNPDLAIWSDTGISGGVMTDYDNDGLTEILVVKNLPAERVIQAYKRDTQGVMKAKHTLSNPTPTSLRNNFVPTIIVDDLDGDNLRDVLCADTDGDVLVYEIVNANVSELRWTARMPVANTYSLAVGDFDGNGSKDFFVGGYNTNILNQALNFWYFEGFKKNGDNSYTSMGSIMFNDVQSQNSICAKDLDNDGKSELVLAISPNLYILKYENGKFVPSFHGDSFRNYQVTTMLGDDGINRILANVSAPADSALAAIWSPSLPFTGPNTPANLVVKPLDASRVKISWIATGSPQYRLYRKDENDNIIFFDLGQVTSYIDSGLTAGKSYSYAIAARDPAFNPEESMPSLWLSAIPNLIPEVVSIHMVGQRELRLIFNQSMPPDFINPGYYHLSNGLGNPISANSILGHDGVQLRFRDTFPAIDSLFVLELRNVTGGTGVAPQQLFYSFPYEADVTSPEVESVTVLSSKKAIAIKYSEELAPAPVSYLPNFIFTPHQNDPDNTIVSATLDVDVITITFAHELKQSNAAYFLETNNLTDLSGNMVSPQHKLVRFAVQDLKNLKDLTVYPNPITYKHPQEAIFVNFPPNKAGKIAIYNSAGNLVYKANIGPFTLINNNITWAWNLKNNDDRPVSSGVYFYVVEMDGEFKRGKLAIIK